MIAKLGLRNVLRNKRRSFLSALAIGIGLSALIFTDGLMIGIRENSIKTVTESYLGHAQIHATGFRENPEVENVIRDYDKVVSKINSASEVLAWAPRIISEGMVTAPSNVQNVQVVGIDKIKEIKVSKISEMIREGNFLESHGNILIGHRLAKKLDLRLGEKIVITVPKVSSNELSQELFRVSGIFKFGSKVQDEGMVFILGSKLSEMLQTKNQFHEIALKFNELKTSQNKLLPVWSSLESEGNILESWSDLVPGIIAILGMSDQSMGIIAGLLLIIVLLSILNTLFMSIFERMFEFGVIQAIGTRASMVFKMILSEALWLGLFSVIVGVALSLLVMFLVNINGIDYAGIEMGEVTLTEPVRSIMTLRQFIYYPLLLMFFTVLAAIYPGFHATKITLAKAMKKSL